MSVKMGEKDATAYASMSGELGKKSIALLISIRRDVGIPFETHTGP
jgi:hypothetical protein